MSRTDRPRLSRGTLAEQIDRVHRLGAWTRVERNGEVHTVYSAAARQLIDTLWMRAWPTLKATLHNGEIRLNLARLDMPMGMVDADLYEAVRTHEHVRDELASAMITAALPPFMRAVFENNKWDPARSELTTFFINACYQRYRGVFRTWAKGWRQLQHDEDTALTLADTKQVNVDVADRATIRHLLAHAPENVRQVLGLIWKGHTEGEIAALLNTSVGAVQNRLYRFRRAVVAREIRAGRIACPAGYRLGELCR
ncbi:sigma factor-like helix-turn-helix DNA-binding protein [Allokutzneria oryzae]|uniref:Sigma factor-like helix-turn-helix DNA-binding protein n=1 Tax=Allokutzneria oryzae TaxID=1378989 RepID=A0ABV5ZR55_9PSEU